MTVQRSAPHAVIYSWSLISRKKEQLANPSPGGGGASRFNNQRCRRHTDSYGLRPRSFEVLILNIDTMIHVKALQSHEYPISRQSQAFSLSGPFYLHGHNAYLGELLNFMWGDINRKTTPPGEKPSSRLSCPLHSLLQRNTCIAFTFLLEHRLTETSAVSAID